MSSSQDQPIKHPLRTLQFYLVVILSGVAGGLLLYFGGNWLMDDMYLTEPPQYPVRSILLGTIDQWPAILRDNIPLGNVVVDVTSVCFFFGLIMAGAMLQHYYDRMHRFGRAGLSCMMILVGMAGVLATLTAADLTGTGWHAGLELGGLAAVGLILVPTLIGLMIIGLRRALPVCWRGALGFARSTRRSYGEHRTVHKKNEVV